MPSCRAILSLALITAAIAASAFAQSDDVEHAFERAIKLHQAGDMEAAISGYKAILTSHPERIDVRSNLGAALSRLGRYEDAIDQYKRALALDSQNQTIRFNLALAYYKAAMFSEAAGEFERFLLKATDSPEKRNAVALFADCQVRLGQYKKVIELLAPMTESQPDDRTLAYLLGSALIGDGQVKRGQLLIDRVFRGEDSAEARLLIGSILLLADDGQGAIKEIERALQLNPKLPSVHAWYGRALMRVGDLDKAQAAFRLELASNPNDFDANVYLGILLRRDKLLDDALAYLSKAVRLRPRDSYARYHLGAVYTGLGKPADALPLLEAVVKEYPDFVEAHVLLASVYYRLNRKEDGQREQSIVLKLNAEQQAKQPGAQESDPSSQSKPPGQARIETSEAERRAA
jgi:tetratricopeptide (TPR) repeat protein